MRRSPSPSRGRSAAAPWFWWASVSQAAAQPSGFDGLVFHDLRRSAITNMIDAGVPELVVMAISGHRSLAMLRRYFIRNTQRMSEALAATRAYVRARQAMADKTRTILPAAALSSS